MMFSTWFKSVFGFAEGSYEATRSRFRVEENDDGGITLVALPNGKDEAICGRRFYVGKFETPSVSALRTNLDEAPAGPEYCQLGEGLTFRHIIGDVTELHQSPTNEGAVFQAASQFNCLEMTGPSVTPDQGITRYCNDHTQGPACALACPAGTLYRNYFVGGHGQGGTKGKQLNTLGDVEAVLGDKYWKMKNGYALPAGVKSMKSLKSEIESGKVDFEAARGALQVGVHWDTEVAVGNPFNVAQVYCSAVPIGYDYSTPKADWEPLARLCLDGSYEATLAVAAILARKGNKRIQTYLTKVGGGVFGNSEVWISDAINRALNLFREEQIDVYLVHYGNQEIHYKEAISEIGEDVIVETSE